MAGHHTCGRGLRKSCHRISFHSLRASLCSYGKRLGDAGLLREASISLWAQGISTGFVQKQFKVTGP